MVNGACGTESIFSVAGLFLPEQIESLSPTFAAAGIVLLLFTLLVGVGNCLESTLI